MGGDGIEEGIGEALERGLGIENGSGIESSLPERAFASADAIDIPGEPAFEIGHEVGNALAERGGDGEMEMVVHDDEEINLDAEKEGGAGEPGLGQVDDIGIVLQPKTLLDGAVGDVVHRIVAKVS